MPVGNQHNWTIVGWQDGVPSINLTPMTASAARGAAKQLGIVYPGTRYEVMLLSEAKALREREKARKAATGRQAGDMHEPPPYPTSSLQFGPPLELDSWGDPVHPFID